MYHRRVFLCVALACVLGIALRVASAGGELWLDEMWSVVLVHEGARSFSDIFLSIPHDNNHLLTSAWLWLVGADAPPFIMRLPSIVCGSLMLVLLAVGSRWAKDVAVYGVWCVACCVSYPFVVYSSEARGYACMGLGLVLSWGALWWGVERGASRVPALLCAGGAAVALLSHGTAIFFLLPVTVWCLGGCTLARGRFPDVGWILLALVPPYVVALLLWVFHYRDLEIGGGTILPYWQVILSTVSVACGGEELSANVVGSTVGAAFLACTVILVALVELLLWIREKGGWGWLVAALIVTPFLALSVSVSEFLAPRYLLVTLMPLYCLLARFVVRLLRRNAVGKIVGISLIGAFLLSSLNHINELITLRRSHFVEIFSDIQRRQAAARIGGDQDFRNGMRFRYAQLVAPELAALTYMPEYQKLDGEDPRAPDVVIKEGSDRYEVLPEEVSLSSGESYQREREYRAPLLSGSRCGVYWRR